MREERVSAVTALELSDNVQTRSWSKLSTITSSRNRIFLSPALVLSRKEGTSAPPSRWTEATSAR